MNTKVPVITPKQRLAMAASENLGLRPRLPLAEATHCMRLSSQVVN